MNTRPFPLFLLALLALLLGPGAFACNPDAPQQSQPRPSVGAEDGGSCATPHEGCACSADEAVDCGETLSRDGGVLQCALGTRACKDGTFGACNVIEVVTRDAPPEDAGRYSTLGLGGSEPCKDNPCDPYCYTFVDNGTGLDAGSPLAVIDGGLTLQPGVPPSPNYNGLAITPVTQNIVITKINPNTYPTTSPPSPILFKAYYTPSAPPAFTPALWTVSDNDNAIINGAGKVTIVGNLPTTFAVNASASGFSAQATVNVTVADTEVTGNPPDFSPPSAVVDSATVLYPYANTIFPRSLTPPVLQWSGGQAATYVKVCLRMRNAANTVIFAWCQIKPEPNPARATFPSYAWKAFETAASGAKAEISLQRYTNKLLQEKVIPIQFSTQPMRGSVYFWEINNGKIARINPDGSLSQNFLAGSHSCNACHSVSADGTTLVAEADGGNGMGVAFDLRANKQMYQRPKWSSFWQALSPDGQWTLWNETPAILSPTSSEAFTGLLYSQYSLLGYGGWGYVDYPAWSPAGGNWIAYADRLYWNYSTGRWSWYVDMSHSDLFLTQFHPPPTVTVDGTQYLPSSGPCAAVGEVAGTVSPAEYRIPTIQCTNGCGETCVAGGNLDYRFNTVGGKSYTVKFKVADYLHNCKDSLSVNAYVDGQFIGSWTGAGTNQWQYPAFSFTAWKAQHIIRITEANDACCGCGCPGVLDPAQCPSCGSPAGCSPWVGDLNLYVDEVSLIDMQESQSKDGLAFDASSGCTGNFGCGPATVPGWTDAPPDAGGCGGTCTAGSWLAYSFATIPGRNYTASFKTAGYLHNCANPLLVYMSSSATNSPGAWKNGQYLAGDWKWQFPQLTFTASSPKSWVFILENNDACCGCYNNCSGACSPQFSDLNMYVDSVTLIKASGSQFFDESQTLVANNWFDDTNMTQINAYPTFSPDDARIVWQTGNSLRTRGNYGNLWSTDRVNPAQHRTKLNQANGVGYLPAGDLNVNYEPSFSPVRSGGFDWLVFVSNRSYGNILPPTASATDQGVKQLWVTAINPNAASNADSSAPAFWLPGQQTTNQNMRGFFAKSPCVVDGQNCEFSDDCCGYNVANPPASTARCLINQPYTNPVTRSCQAVKAFSCVADSAACAQDTDCCTYPQDLCIQGLCKTPPPPPQYQAGVYTRDYSAACAAGTSAAWQLLKWVAFTPGDSKIDFYAATSDTLAGLPAASLSPAAPAVLVTTATNQNGSKAFVALGSALPGKISKNYLRMYDVLSPTTDGTMAPVLTDWQVTYDCIPTQ